MSEKLCAYCGGRESQHPIVFRTDPHLGECGCPVFAPSADAIVGELNIPGATRLTGQDWVELLYDVADVYDKSIAPLSAVEPGHTTATGNDLRALGRWLAARRDESALDCVAAFGQFATLVARYLDPNRHSAIRDDRSYWESQRESDKLRAEIMARLATLSSATGGSMSDEYEGMGGKAELPPLGQPSADATAGRRVDFRDAYRREVDKALSALLPREAAHEVGLFAVYLVGKAAARRNDAAGREEQWQKKWQAAIDLRGEAVLEVGRLREALREIAEALPSNASWAGSVAREALKDTLRSATHKPNEEK